MNMPDKPNCIGPLVDISGNNSNVDLAAAKAGGVMAVFVKATEGATFQDPSFAANLKKVRDQGLRVGAYHFGTARPAADQVKNFIDTVTKAAGSFKNIVPALDVENNDPSPGNTITPAIADEWVRLFKLNTGFQPVVYAGAFLQEHGGATPNMKGSPLWLAAYVPEPKALTGWTDFTFWQYTDGRLGPFAGTVPGLGACDQNIFRGTQADLDALWQKYA
jgi:lysozyme